MGSLSEVVLGHWHIFGQALCPRHTVLILTRDGHTTMKFSISSIVNSECDEKLKDSRSSCDGYTIAREGFTMANEPYTWAIGRTHEFNISG